MLRREDLEREIGNRWKSVLQSVLGLSDEEMSGKGVPCPICGGEDRFNYTNKFEKGNYFCRNCEPGDGWTLIQKVKNIDFIEALRLVGDHLGMKEQENRFIIPAPKPLDYTPGQYISLLNKDDKPQSHQYEYIWPWLQQDGKIIGYLGRKADKNTHRIFYTRKGWAQGTLPYEPWPLFGLHTINTINKAVYVVEGEKTWQAVVDKIPGASVVTWVGGAQSVKKSNWKALKGKTLILCPDNDKPGREAMQYIAKQASGSVFMFQHPDEHPDAWDVADYDGEDLEAFIDEHLVDHNEVQEEQLENVLEVLRKAIKPLGFDKTKLYFFPTNRLQVLELNSSDLGKGNLRMLASDSLWKLAFPTERGIDWDMASDWVQRQCEKKGIFNHMNLRGNGVWRDGSKAVVHMGDHLLVNMERKSLNDFESKYIYQQARKIEMPTVTLLQEEKQLLIDIANKIRWREKCSADILLSYILIAPLSAYWEWRPNVWQRGPAGAGKSTILEFFVKPCLGDMCISFEGDTTEAGIRQTIGTNAMAVIFDEPEADSYSGNQKIEQILKFIRSNASISTGVIAKGTSNQTGIQFQAQCMFLLASINSIPMKPQDKDRITCIELLGREGNTLEHWRQLERLLHALPKDIHQKIFYYMISNIDWAHKVIAQFKEFYFMRTGSRRTGDQFGPLSAGKYLLLGNGQEIPTMEEIEKLVDDSVWSLINENQQRTNEEDFINFIRDVELTIEDLNRNSKKRLLSEVVKIIKEDKAIAEFSTIEASKALQRKGMKVSKDRNTGKLRFHVSKNSDTFMSFFRQKPEFANYQVLLNRLPGAASGQARINDKNFATIHIPVELLITDEDKFGEPRTRPPVENHTVDIEWD